MHDCSSVRLIWAGDPRPAAGATCLGASCQAPQPWRRAPQAWPELGLLTVKAFLGPRLDLGSGLGEFCQPLLAARQFVGDRQAVGQVRAVGRLGLGQQLGHFDLQLRLDLAGMLIGQRAVPAGIGMDLGAVPCPS